MSRLQIESNRFSKSNLFTVVQTAPGHRLKTQQVSTSIQDLEILILVVA